jgi:hypothetical protein
VNIGIKSLLAGNSTHSTRAAGHEPFDKLRVFDSTMACHEQGLSVTFVKVGKPLDSGSTSSPPLARGHSTRAAGHEQGLSVTRPASNGCPGWDRTSDQVINSYSLYVFFAVC